MTNRDQQERLELWRRYIAQSDPLAELMAETEQAIARTDRILRIIEAIMFAVAGAATGFVTALIF